MVASGLFAREGVTRCAWCQAGPDYIASHDHEWGFPVRDDRRLFEKISLEGFQSGLSWLTILRKRENYRKAFDGFDVRKVAAYRKPKIEALLVPPVLAKPPNQRVSSEVDAHAGAIAGGLAHFAGLPRIEIDGDTATVYSYLQILTPHPTAEPHEVPNHGTTKGFRIHRVGANRWDLVRTNSGWKIKQRTLRPLDGSEPARELLRGALRDFEPRR